MYVFSRNGFVNARLLKETDNINSPEDPSNDDRISTPVQVVNTSFQYSDLYISNVTFPTALQVFEESNSEASIDTCVDDISESVSIIADTCVKNESCNLAYRCASGNTLFLSNNNDDDNVEHLTFNAEESLQQYEHPTESLSVHLVENNKCSLSQTILTKLCETILEERTVLCQRKASNIRGLGNGSSSDDDDDDDDDDNGEDRRGVHTTLVTHHHSSNPQHSLASSPRYKSLSTAVNTPQTSVGTGQGSLRHDNRMGEVATKTNAMGMGIMLPTSPIVYSNKGDYRYGQKEVLFCWMFLIGKMN